MLALKVAVVVESVYIHLSLLIDSTSSIPSSRRKACLDGCLQNKIPSKLQRRKLSFFCPFVLGLVLFHEKEWQQKELPRRHVEFGSSSLHFRSLRHSLCFVYYLFKGQVISKRRYGRRPHCWQKNVTRTTNIGRDRVTRHRLYFWTSRPYSHKIKTYKYPYSIKGYTVQHVGAGRIELIWRPTVNNNSGTGNNSNKDKVGHIS